MMNNRMTPAFARIIIASVEDGLIAPDEPVAKEARRVLDIAGYEQKGVDEILCGE